MHAVYVSYIFSVGSPHEFVCSFLYIVLTQNNLMDVRIVVGILNIRATVDRSNLNSSVHGNSQE